MNILALSLHNYDSNYFYCLDSKPNLIMNGNFTKINYTHPHFTMNGLFFSIPLTSSFVENASENTHFVHFDMNGSGNKAILESIIKLEYEILQNYTAMNNKIMSRYMYKQLSKGKIKINGENTVNVHSKNNKIVLKISGVWENETEYGMTFRWVYANLIR
jgi:hypothetical protein